MDSQSFKAQSVFLGVGVALLSAAGFWGFGIGNDLIRARASSAWPRTRARIMESTAGFPTGPERVHDCAWFRIRYSYDVGGRHFEGNEVNVGNTVDCPRIMNLPRQYPEGAEVEVAYDPGDPSRSVLEPGIARGHLAALVLPGVAGTIGLLALGAGVLGTRR